jgi:DNA-binding response OmpR family regulator
MNILIAEDDISIREGLVYLLNNEGYETLAAENGARAVALFHAHSPDLILLDIMMPEMDGYQVCREIRRHNTSVPVLFLSAKSEEIDKVVGLELGADDFIIKPFGTRELIARIRAITRRTLNQQQSSPDHDEFWLDDVKISPRELKTTRNQESMDLSLRDIAILRLLYTQRGKVVTRDMFFDTCWGHCYLPNSRTLDQHISRLRKCIEKDPAAPRIIRTVHGAGYRYDA